MQQEISFSDLAIEIARSLVEENGLKRAQQIAVEGISNANERGNFYRLSIWREVKRSLREGTDSAEYQKE